MPLEHMQTAGVLPRAERRQAGRALRKIVPRSLHGQWAPSPKRRDPVDLLVETGRHRIASLLPIRYDRMRASPFAFFRGAAAIMAADLADTPSSGLWVQACGDCHLANFGVFASPVGNPVFDLNDFDETLPAPFEWDVKRLAASFAIDALSRGLGNTAARQMAAQAMEAYRRHLQDLARQDPLRAWWSHVGVAELLGGIDDARLREREMRRLETAVEAGHQGYPRLVEKSRGLWRIKEKPPLVVPLSSQRDDTHEIVARTAFEAYRLSLPEERRVLLDRYELADVAFKVVGVGSVGTFCAIGLFVTRDDQTLLLQLKEAQASALAPYAGSSLYHNQGQRVVVGQRMMQSQPDPFLGWTQESGNDQHCYVRHFRDSRLSPIGQDLAEEALPYHATLCGIALARAHARSGDAARIAGYLGTGRAFDVAVARFALAYAAQNELDWRLFLEAIKAGQIEARAA
ncbi:DUF2252 domain-containing protein [Rhodopila globiformis]|uniref:DUF2252 domain-containing protein n=1 Tax=Rhodopila globiformis TaxID=1071 RepID=A0A2S6NNZ0_RHOGL|nr:DUF2252 domain-containing protein [Rhodopila globiformis]PPQ39540.1 hypothetical protein CCS01_01205 [Rhodopila globiformis]